MAKKNRTYSGKPKPMGRSGHFHEPRRHSLQAKGIKTGNLAKKRRWVASTLINDEVSSDSQLVDYFKKVGDMSEEEAKFYVSQRDEALKDPMDFGLKRFTKDSDGDGVSDAQDCQPNNPNKQDEKWFKEAIMEDPPYTLGGWSKDLPATTRRDRALESRDGRKNLSDRHLSAGRALQALANVTQDKETKRIAEKDADYHFKMSKKYKKRRT